MWCITSKTVVSQLIGICLPRYGLHITKASYFICHDPKVIQQLFDNLRNYDGKDTYPKSCGRFKVSGIRDLTTGYDSSQPDQKAVSVLLPYRIMCKYVHIRMLYREIP